MEYGNLSESDTVLEIGPGIGNLTIRLCKFAGRVVAVEKDSDLFDVLENRTTGLRNLRTINSDVLEMELPEFDKVISNLPYSISSPVTFKLLKKDFQLGVLMYQKEFADRMFAEPGSSEYGRLSVSVYYKARCEHLRDVSPSCFIPHPRVESSLVRLIPRKSPFSVEDEDLFFRVVRGSFQHRRKKLRNALYHSFESVFPEMDIPEKGVRSFIDEALPEEFLQSRPGDLTPENYGEISNLFAEVPDF